jgi:hypothetical protein
MSRTGEKIFGIAAIVLGLGIVVAAAAGLTLFADPPGCGWPSRRRMAHLLLDRHPATQNVNQS